MIADHPLLGVGPGEVRTWYQHYRRPEAVRPSTGHLHNSAIQIAAERGLPALIAWMWLWVVFFREGWRILGRTDRESPMRRALVCASLAGAAGFLVAGLFEHNFGDAEVATVVLALMAQPWVVARELGGSGDDRAGARRAEARPPIGGLAAARAPASLSLPATAEGLVSSTASRAAAAASRTEGSSSCQAAWRRASDATWASAPARPGSPPRSDGSSDPLPRLAPPPVRESLEGRTGRAPGGPSSASRPRTPEAIATSRSREPCTLTGGPGPDPRRRRLVGRACDRRQERPGRHDVGSG